MCVKYIQIMKLGRKFEEDQQIIFSSKEWLSPYRSAQIYTMNTMSLTNHVVANVSWTPPSGMNLKINVDVACDLKEGKSRVGFVL